MGFPVKIGSGRKTRGSALGDAKEPKPDKATSADGSEGDIKVRVARPGKKKGKKK